MRTSNGVQYPDSTAMAFAPVLFVCEESGCLALEVTLTNGLQTVTATHDAFGGNAYVDMSDYVHGLFGRVDMPSSYASASASGSMAQMTYFVRKRTSSGWAMAVNGGVTRFIWGALKRGETWGCNRYLVRTPGLPFCVDLYKLGSQTFNFRGGGRTAQVSASSVGLWHVPIPSTFDGMDYVEVDDSLGTAIIRMDSCDDGILLRWIDRHGLLCHRTFTKGTAGTESAISGEYRRNNLLDWDGSYGWRGMSGDGYVRTRTDTIEVCADGVREEETATLRDLASSPMVEMYTGAAWVRVRIKQGEWKLKETPLQDIEFTVIEDDISLQRG